MGFSIDHIDPHLYGFNTQKAHPPSINSPDAQKWVCQRFDQDVFNAVTTPHQFAATSIMAHQYNHGAYPGTVNSSEDMQTRGNTRQGSALQCRQQQVETHPRFRDSTGSRIDPFRQSQMPQTYQGIPFPSHQNRHTPNNTNAFTRSTQAPTARYMDSGESTSFGDARFNLGLPFSPVQQTAPSMFSPSEHSGWTTCRNSNDGWDRTPANASWSSRPVPQVSGHIHGRPARVATSSTFARTTHNSHLAASNVSLTPEPERSYHPAMSAAHPKPPAGYSRVFAGSHSQGIVAEDFTFSFEAARCYPYPARGKQVQLGPSFMPGQSSTRVTFDSEVQLSEEDTSSQPSSNKNKRKRQSYKKSAAPLDPLQTIVTKQGTRRIRGVNTDFPKAPSVTSPLPSCEMGMVELLTFFPHHTAWPSVILRALANGWLRGEVAQVVLFARGTLNEISLERRASTLRWQISTAVKAHFTDRKYTYTEACIDGQIKPVTDYDVSGYAPHGGKIKAAWSDAEPVTLLSLAEGVVNWPQDEDAGIVTQVIRRVKHLHENALEDGSQRTTEHVVALAQKWRFVMPAESLGDERDDLGKDRVMDDIEDAKN